MSRTDPTIQPTRRTSRRSRERREGIVPGKEEDNVTVDAVDGSPLGTERSRSLPRRPLRRSASPRETTLSSSAKSDSPPSPKRAIKKTTTASTCTPEDTAVANDSRKAADTSSAFVNLCCVLFVVLVVTIFFYVVWYHVNHVWEYLRPVDGVRPYKEELPQDFVHSMERLNKSFVSQESRTWSALKSRGLRHIRSNDPVQPAVFLLAAGPSALQTAECLAVSLAAAFSGQGNRTDVLINGEIFRGKDGNTAKKEIDDILERNLSHTSPQTESPPVVLIQRLHLLPAPSPLIFFKYCDNQDAPVRRAVFIFTLRLPGQPPHNLTPAQKENHVISFMTKELWALQNSKWYSEDTVEPLVTRLSDVTVIVQQEEQHHLEKYCKAS